MTQDDVRSYVVNWNTRFPLDRWWRKKYNITFNSPVHRESCFLDQLFEWEEEQLFEELYNEDPFTPNSGNWIKQQKITEENLADQIASFRKEVNEFNSVEDEL